MARAIRIEFPGALYHVTSRGNRRKRIFDDDADRVEFLRMVGEAVRRYGWIISSFVLMPNHFHLVLQTPRPDLALGMQWLNSAYAGYYNRRHGKVGHLFGERYKAIHVESEEYLQRLVRYVVLNPARMTVAADYSLYRWSSFRATAGLEMAPEWLALEPLVRHFGEASTWRANYIEYVANGLANPDPIWRGLRRGIYLGSEQWLREIRQKITHCLRKTDIPRDQRTAGRPSMGRIAARVASDLGLRERDLKRGHGGLARKIAAWLGVYEGCGRLRVIAQTLHLRSCSRVTQLVQECDLALRHDRDLREQVREMRLSLA